MQTLSALDCISPAISCTKRVLFSPFRKGRSWKLAATAYLAMAGIMFFPFPLIYLVFLPAARRSGGMIAEIVLIAGSLFATAIFAVIFYLCSRLQFAFFDVVLNRGEFVAPAWRKHGRQARVWTLVKVLFGTVATLAVAAPVGAYAVRLFGLMKSIKPGQQPPPEFFGAIFAGYGLIFLFFASFGIFSMLLSDFIVPSLALEDTGLGEAFRRFFELVRREPGQFAAYVLTKFGLGCVVYMGATLVFEIVLILVVLILMVVFGLIGFLLHLAGVPTLVLTVLGILIGIACYALIIGYGLLLVVGTFLTVMQAYTLYFLGGRYPLLGGLLEEAYPAPAPYVPPVQYAPIPPPQPPIGE